MASHLPCHAQRRIVSFPDERAKVTKIARCSERTTPSFSFIRKTKIYVLISAENRALERKRSFFIHP